MPKYRKFSKVETAYMQANHGKITLEEMSDALGRTVADIQNHLKKNPTLMERRHAHKDDGGGDGGVPQSQGEISPEAKVLRSMMSPGDRGITIQTPAASQIFDEKVEQRGGTKKKYASHIYKIDENR